MKFRQLDADLEASGPHDFTVRVCAVRQKRIPRPPHPAPRIVTIASRPLGRNGTVYRIIRNLDTVKSCSVIQKINPPRQGEAEPGGRCINSRIVPGQNAPAAGILVTGKRFFGYPLSMLFCSAKSAKTITICNIWVIFRINGFASRPDRGRSSLITAL
jgi:hypothetical protein